MKEQSYSANYKRSILASTATFQIQGTNEICHAGGAISFEEAPVRYVPSAGILSARSDENPRWYFRSDLLHMEDSLMFVKDKAAHMTKNFLKTFRYCNDCRKREWA